MSKDKIQYGNQRDYIEDRLRREGHEQLADAVRAGRLSAQFAKHLARTVPRKRLHEAMLAAEFFGPVRPPNWDWQSALATWKRYA
jgi:hypothetical protein